MAQSLPTRLDGVCERRRSRLQTAVELHLEPIVLAFGAHVHLCACRGMAEDVAERLLDELIKATLEHEGRILRQIAKLATHHGGGARFVQADGSSDDLGQR